MTILRKLPLNNGVSLPKSIFPYVAFLHPMTVTQQARPRSTVYQSQPRLPVPDAERTLSHFLDFSKALLNKRDFAETEKVVQDFRKNELPQLQKLLQQRGAKMNNWLTPWWLNVAYLQARTPLPVVTSPGVLFPKWDDNQQNPLEAQIHHATAITCSALQFYKLVQSEQLPQDKAGSSPMDMSQYKYLFGTSRLPNVGIDTIKIGYFSGKLLRHIAVMRNGHAVHVPVLDQSGNILSSTVIESNIRKAVALTGQRNPHQLGIVSSDKRDAWAKVYSRMKKSSDEKKKLEALEDALFVVCIDNETIPEKGYTEKDEQARATLHGSGSANNSGNRWFDKTIQFIVGHNGYCGMTYEHTPAEGPPVARLMDFICDQVNGHSWKTDGGEQSEEVERLDFNLDDETKLHIVKSSKNMDRVVNDLDVHTYTFKQFGKNFPKTAKVSPDSFIQLAYQLAYFRIHKTLPPTYETATLRKFDEGRTENIRLPNTKTRSFCEMVAEGRHPIAELYDVFRVAIESHKNYASECMNGAGMDRHLLAWKLLANEHQLPIPSILQTDVYRTMMHFTVSTSQVPTKNFIQMCFGPSDADCYGICYNPQEREIHFTITTFKHQGCTNPRKFARELEKALVDMRAIVVKATKETQSKL